MILNKVLNSVDREELIPIINQMSLFCSKMMARKPTGSEIQQAFVLDTIFKNIGLNKTVPILSVGCDEDTAYEFLRLRGYLIAGIDPSINYSLRTYINENQTASFPIIFSTSVIEHVENDEEFIEDICKILSPNGVVILTCDFNNDYVTGRMKKPDQDFRFYTIQDLQTRLKNVLDKNSCSLISPCDWSGTPNFAFCDCHYSFATYVFSKNL